LAEFEESIAWDDRFDITLSLSNACADFVRAIMSCLIIHYSLFFPIGYCIFKGKPQCIGKK
jgi:hypothetical protein